MFDLVFTVFSLVIISIIVVLVFLNRGQYGRIEILRRGIRTQGEVIDLDIYGLEVFYRLPVVRFKTASGQYVTFTSSTKIAIGELSRGEKVEVCYLPIAPEQFVIVSGLDVLVKSETQVTKVPYRLAKGQEPYSRRRSQ